MVQLAALQVLVLAIWVRILVSELTAQAPRIEGV